MVNYDEKTGISYGVISPNGISQEVLSDLQISGTDPQYESSKSEFIDSLKVVLENYNFSVGQIDEVIDPALDIFNESYESSCDGTFDYEDKDYTLHNSSDNFGLFVIRSPYYTYCRKCSPCAPGAGDLNNPYDVDGEDRDDYDRAYCLDKSYFDDEKAPYRVFRVDNNEEVF